MHKEVLTKEGARLFPALAAFSAFYLAGGTALALQIGHRVSVDFDFFSPEPIPRNLLNTVKRVFEGSALQVLINNTDELTVLVDGVKVTFLSYPFTILSPLVTLGALRLLSVAEIGTTKAYTVGRRGTYKDYVDLYFILKDGHSSLRDLVRSAERKFGGEFNSRLFLEQLLFMDDLTDYQIDLIGAPVAASEILDFFQGMVERLPLTKM
jgi:hypothetical protein